MHVRTYQRTLKKKIEGNDASLLIMIGWENIMMRNQWSFRIGNYSLAVHDIIILDNPYVRTYITIYYSISVHNYDNFYPSRPEHSICIEKDVHAYYI